MTLDELISELKDAGLNQNTLTFVQNCYELGRHDFREKVAAKLLEMPVNDTAASIAIWIKAQE